MQLSGKRIIVTGGARGIGLAAVRALAAEGAAVASLDIQHDPDATDDDGTLKLQCDVADEGSVDSAIQTSASRLGGVDALVHVAGVISHFGSEEIPLAEWQRIMAINATGTLLMNQAVFPHLRAAGGGSIVNAGSVAGVRGFPQGAHYAASKGAVLAWTRTIADEWGKFDIRANAIAPSVWTPMYDEWRRSLAPDELAAHDDFQRASTPIGGKLGDPDRDLAPLLVFLVSDGSRFITGQTIAVDGGKLKLS